MDNEVAIIGFLFNSYVSLPKNTRETRGRKFSLKDKM